MYEWIQLVIVGSLFPFAGYFFRKNERLHEQTQTKQGLQDTRLTVLELRVSLIERQLGVGLPGNGSGSTTINL